MSMYVGTPSEVEKGELYVKEKRIYYPKNRTDSDSFFWIPDELVESTWKPVYREKPVFKVGDWVVWTPDNTPVARKISEKCKFHSNCWNLSCYEYSSCHKDYLRHATPEEIESARPKRKYMKQVWYVLVMDENFNSLLVSKQHETEEQAHQWTLENSEEGRVYSIKPFEVVAYE